LERRSKNIRKEIGTNFKRMRIEKSLSLREVEAITGVDHSWLAKFEKGQVNFEIDTLINLADNFDIDVRLLFVFAKE
jgi:transcriptional regulator with XRE-family HTH domain